MQFSYYGRGLPWRFRDQEAVKQAENTMESKRYVKCGRNNFTLRSKLQKNKSPKVKSKLKLNFRALPEISPYKNKAAGL